MTHKQNARCRARPQSSDLLGLPRACLILRSKLHRYLRWAGFSMFGQFSILWERGWKRLKLGCGVRGGGGYDAHAHAHIRGFPTQPRSSQCQRAVPAVGKAVSWETKARKNNAALIIIVVEEIGIFTVAAM